MKPRDIIDLLLLAAVWGGSFLFMRLGAPQFGAFPLAALRVAIGGLFLLPFLCWRGKAHVMGERIVPLFFLGAINSAIPFSLWAFVSQYMTAGVASILNATSPLFTALIGALWLRDRLRPLQVAGLIVGFFGVVVLMWGKAAFVGENIALSVVASLSATFMYGIATNYTKRYLTGVDPLASSTGSLLIAALLLAPFAALHWPAESPDALAWMGVILLGVFCTGLAYIAYFRLIDAIGPARTIAVTYLIPAFGMLWGLIFLGEPITLRMLLGSGVILMGTALTTGVVRWPRRG